MFAPLPAFTYLCVYENTHISMKLRLFLIAPLLMVLCCGLTGCRQKETQNELYSRLHTGVVVVLNRYYYQIGLPGGGKLYFSGLDATATS